MDIFTGQSLLVFSVRFKPNTDCKGYRTDKIDASSDSSND